MRRNDNEILSDEEDSSFEVKQYFKLGEILAETELLSSQIVHAPSAPQITNELETCSMFLEEEFDPFSTYYYLGNIYADTSSYSFLKKQTIMRDSPEKKPKFAP